MGQEEQQQILESINKYAHLFNSMMQSMLSKDGNHPGAELFDPQKILNMLGDKVQIDPNKLMTLQMSFLQKQSSLWQQASLEMMGEKLNPIISENKSDRRFNHNEWSENPVYSYLKQAYLLNAEMLQNIIDAIEFKDEKAARQAKFYTRQYINSVSPTNYVLTNPEVCEEILRTKGESILRGMQKFMDDVEKSPLEAFKITQTDASAFTVGENLATTAGQVIYKNDLIELIHYQPLCPEVNASPMLFVPPFINKYYILDLDEKKSMVKGLLEGGNELFMISWVNPDASHAQTNFFDYVRTVGKAFDVVADITQAAKINIGSFCVGGTLSATYSAWRRAQGDERIGSLTMFTTLLDFSEPGELGNYLNEDMLNLLEQNTAMKGVFDGRILGMSFSFLRENSLFWSFFIKHYLEGKDPAPFDILYWNSDPTNISADCYMQYLTLTYWENKLKEPGAIEIDGIPIDLGNIDFPVYFISTIADHIVLWKSSYAGTKLVSGPVRFVLAGSGHLAGVINPIEGGKYPHWLNDDLPDTPEAWFENSSEHPGSWWPNWFEWLAERDQHAKRKPLQPGQDERFPALYPAPGEYVHKRL